MDLKINSTKNNFTGLKNVGGFGISNGIDVLHFLNFELTNTGTKDLAEFEKILKKYPHPINKNFINFCHLTKDDTYSFNGKTLEVCDKNLEIFEKISKLLKRIGQYKENMPLNKDYLYGPDAQAIFGDIIKTERIPYDKQIREIHSKDMVKNVSIVLKSLVKKTMAKYFEV